ncbi:hypothetical protein [Steroidobacter sp.]|uniref:hypothetical protein n=1 Tax=Steroidobacter sp. TaxID=1978227 RepID=UPI0025EDE6CC|nr:hypothetical protein [Steroidobacter sp.]
MVTIILICGTFAIFALLLCGLWSLQRNFRITLEETQANILASSGDAAKRDERLLDTLRLLQMSPFGVPDGTIRAIIALALVAVGLLILLTHKAIGLTGVGEISGLLGTVLGFYFGTRTGESGAQQQAKQATDEANAANTQAAAATARAEEAIRSADNAATQAQEAARTAATGGAGAAAADPKSDEARTKLGAMRSRLEVNRQITRALQQQQSGASVAGDAQSTLSKVDALLQSVDLAIRGKVTGQELLDVVQKTEALLPQLEQVGMPGVFGDAIATLKGALSSGVQIAAVAGNPAGIIGGLVLAGLKLRQQQEQFQKWREAVLLQPYDRSALPIDVTDTTAGVIVEQTELAKTRLANFPPGQLAGATALVKAALARDANNTPRSAATVAAELYASADFKAAFLSEDELLEAIEEVRQSANFKRVLEALPLVVELPPVNGTPQGVPIQLRTLLELVPLLRRDARVAAELERIAAVVEILKNQTGFTDNELLPLVQQALASGAALAESARQTQEPPRQE